MASSENLSSIEPWAFRSALADSLFAEYFARDAETLTKALQKSISGATMAMAEDAVSPFFNAVKADATAAAAATPTTPAVSGLSGGSDQESAPKRRSAAVAGVNGKISKRKSRASKRSQTTFITADPANFRQMVQQVTGVRFTGSQMPMAPVVKPEPQRLNGATAAAGGVRLPGVAGCLPTLDTSAFLLEHHQQQVVGPNSSATGPAISGPGPLPFGPSVGVVDGSLAAAGLDFEAFSSFPTLESWKVM